MTKNEYLESQRGKVYSQIVAEQPTEMVQGSLLKLHYQELKTILGAGGLRDHLDTFGVTNEFERKALSAVNETFTEQYMADADFKVNFTIPEIMAAFNQVVALGVIPEPIGQQLLNLAKYQRSVYNITILDCVQYFEPEKLNIGDWNVLTVTNKSRLFFKLKTATPEIAAVRIETRQSHDGVHWSNWERTMPLIVQEAGNYYHNFPRSNLIQELRYRGEVFFIDSDVEAI